MSDPIHDNQDVPNDANETPAVDNARRKLAGTALGVAAVFTLSSRPVWATGGQQCTISGMMSGNLSAPKGSSCEGCRPDYWKGKKDKWEYRCGVKHTDKFKDVFRCNDLYKKNGRSCTLYEVLNREGNSDEMGSQAVAAYLNAAEPSVNFGYSAGEISELFRQNYLGNGAKLASSLTMLNNRSCPLS